MPLVFQKIVDFRRTNESEGPCSWKVTGLTIGLQSKLMRDTLSIKKIPNKLNWPRSISHDKSWTDSLNFMYVKRCFSPFLIFTIGYTWLSFQKGKLSGCFFLSSQDFSFNSFLDLMMFLIQFKNENETMTRNEQNFFLDYSDPVNISIVELSSSKSSFKECHRKEKGSPQVLFGPALLELQMSLQPYEWVVLA